MSVSPLKSPLRIGLIGAGYIAQWHAKAVKQRPEAELVAIVDVSDSRAKAAAAEFGIPNHYSLVDALIASKSVDVVHVLVPPDLHAPVTKQCIEAGLHVFLEKPMATHSVECGEIVKHAIDHNVQLGINHNFLFSRVYNELRKSVQCGELGRIDAIDISWNKPLPQLVHGPFSIWMLRQPENLLLELGPHVVSPILDLAEFPSQMTGIATHPITMPGGRSSMRNFAFSMTAGRVAVQARLSLGSGTSEFIIHVRGSHGSATADLDDNTFTVNRATKYSMDFDRYHRLKGISSQIKSQAKRGLRQYIGSKVGLSKNGNPYGESIAGAVATFYQSLLKAEPIPSRLSGEMGQASIRLCEELFRSLLPPVLPDANINEEISDHSNNEIDPSGTQKPCLVFGGTGFIGQALVQSLIARGRKVRCFVRRPSDVPDALRHPAVELFQGDMANSANVDAAMQGIEGVYHLARGMAKTWSEYVLQDVEPTKMIAMKCLEHSAGRLVYTSTIDSYYAGSRAGTITESTPLDPNIEHRNLYAKSKSVLEDELNRLHREKNLDVVITRPGIVVGKGGSPFHWGVGMWNGESNCQIWGDGNNPLPLVLVNDVAEGLVGAMEKPGIAGASFNFVGEPLLTAREYMTELQRAGGIKIEVEPTSIWKFYVTDMFKWTVKCAVRHPERRRPSFQDWESRTQKAHFDCTRTKEVLGWQPNSSRDDLIKKGIVEAVVSVMA